MTIAKHFTATTIIVYQEKALLHLHRKLQIWLPVGGHIESGELPQEAAVREVIEETGLEIDLYNPDQQVPMGDVEQLIRPIYLLSEKVNPTRQDVDYIYYASAHSSELKPQDGETNHLRWLTSEEIKQLKNVPENVRVLVLEAIKLIGSKKNG